MSRDEFLDWLAHAVELDLLTIGEARELRRQFDAGEFEASDLPLPLRESIAGYDDDANEEALLLLLLLLGNRSGRVQQMQREAALAAARAALQASTTTRQKYFLNTLQKEFEDEVAQLADELARTGNVRRWHREMHRLVKRHTLEQANLGAGGRPFTRSYRQHLDETLRYHTGRLSRFADQVAIGHKHGEPYSTDYVRWRSQQYGGAGRGEFYRAGEIVDAQGAGYVVDYIAVDDANTCSPCSRAQREGPYLEGQGPFPGQVCLGRAKCRCDRVRRYAPAEYSELIAKAA